MWELLTRLADGRYIRDDSLESDERGGWAGPEMLINPKEGRIVLWDGREVDAMVGEGGLAVVTCASLWADSEPYADEADG